MAEAKLAAFKQIVAAKVHASKASKSSPKPAEPEPPKPKPKEEVDSGFVLAKKEPVLTTAEKREKLNRVRSVDKFEEMKLNISRMREEKRSSVGSSVGLTLQPGQKSPRETSPRSVHMAEEPEKPPQSSPRTVHMEEKPSDHSADDRGRSATRDDPNKKMKRSTSVQKWQELKQKTEQMRSNKEREESERGPRVDRPKETKMMFAASGDNAEDRMASGKKTLEEMKQKTAARRQRKEEQKRARVEKKNDLDGKVNTFIGMLSNIENMIQSFEREKEKATTRIKALESENATLQRKYNEMRYNPQLDKAKEDLSDVLKHPTLQGLGILEQLKEIKLLFDAATGDFNAARLVSERNAELRRGSIMLPAPPPIIAAGGGPPPPPPPPPPPSAPSLPPLAAKLTNSGGASKAAAPPPDAGCLLSAIRLGTTLKKVDHEQVAKEKEESSDSLFKSLEDTMKMALGIRRAVMETQESDSDSDSDEDWESD